MFLQLLFVCLLATKSLAKPNDNVIADIIRPRAFSSDAHDAKIRSFWTDERLKAAKPLNFTLPGIFNRAGSSNLNISTGPPSDVAGTLPTYSSKLSRAISSKGRQIYTTGRVFWQVGQSSYSCSAAVITSKSTDLIVTAGHCVYDVSTKTWYNNNNWVFIPAYSNNNRPYGTWTGRRFLIKQAYTTGDYNYDVAFVAVSKLNQRSIQSIVGSQGIGFNFARSARIYSFGYPGNLDNGRYLKSCLGNAQASKYTGNKYIGQGLPCNMGHGCSGGPWLQNVVDSTGVGYVTSVNSFLITNVPNVINGPYFENNIKSLYDQATSM